MRVVEVEEKTVTYTFQIIRQHDGKLAAEGSMKCIAVNADWKAVPLPTELAKALKRECGVDNR
jgi:acyl-CoA thioesterase FadM